MRWRPVDFAIRYQCLFPLYARLPVKWAYRCAAWQAPWFQRQRVAEAASIRQQMQRALPQATTTQLDTWLRDYYRMVEQEALDTWFLDHQPISEIVTLQNFAVVEAARRRGQRVLLTGGHFGRFWLAGAAMRARGFTTGTITRDGGKENVHGLHPAEFRYRSYKLQGLQRILGGPFLVEGEDLRPLYRALDNHLITLIFDVPYPQVHTGNVTTPFINTTIGLPVGIYRIAKKMQAIVVPFYMHECGNGQVTAVFADALMPQDYEEQAFMQLLAAQLAQHVAANPGHWWLWPALPLLEQQTIMGREHEFREQYFSSA